MAGQARKSLLAVTILALILASFDPAAAQQVRIVESFLCSGNHFDADRYECRFGGSASPVVFEATTALRVFCYTKFRSDGESRVLHVWIHRGERLPLNAIDDTGSRRTFYDDQERLLKKDIPGAIMNVVEEVKSGNFGNALAVVRLLVAGSETYRTYSSKKIDPAFHKGPWTVRVTDESGRILSVLDFIVK